MGVHRNNSVDFALEAKIQQCDSQRNTLKLTVGITFDTVLEEMKRWSDVRRALWLKQRKVSAQKRKRQATVR